MTLILFFHIVACILHFGQSITQFVISQELRYVNKTIAVTRTVLSQGSSFQENPWNNTGNYSTVVVGYVHPMIAIATFFLLTAFFHGVIACTFHCKKKTPSEDETQQPFTPKKNQRFFKKNKNIPPWEEFHFRWMEYSITSTLMVMIVSLMVGITDLYAIMAIVGCNVGMILCGWISDEARLYTDSPRVARISHFTGWIVGIPPWIAIFTQVGVLGIASVPVVGPIVVSMTVITFLLFFVFALISLKGVIYFSMEEKNDNVSNDQLDKKQLRNRMNTENKQYLFMSFVTKTFLAWIIYGAFLNS